MGIVGYWTHVEEEKLVEGLKLYSFDWDKINKHLGTNRTIMGL